MTGQARPALSDPVYAPSRASLVRQAMSFLLIVFPASWACWAAASVLAPHRPVAYLPGTVMPAIVALWLTSRQFPSGARALAARTLMWRVSPWFYAFAIGYMAAVKLGTAGTLRLVEGSWPPFTEAPLLLMVLGGLFSTPIQAGEEIGWRGYILPRLGYAIGFGPASLLVGFAWALWHLPMFFFAGGDMVGQSFPAFLLVVAAISVAMSWLYVRTGGSLLLVMLMHAFINNMTGIVPSSSASPSGVFGLHASASLWITIAFLWIVAAVLLWDMRKWTRSPPP